MKRISMIAAAVATTLFAGAATAATVKVEWKNVEDYRDIEAVNGIQERYEANIMKELTEKWEEEGAKLPETNELLITMTDLDIAGRVEPTFGTGASSYIRVLDSLSYPSLTFSFSYRDADGNEIASGEDVRLKDIAGQTNTIRTAMGVGKDSLYREKRLIEKWFENDFMKDKS